MTDIARSTTNPATRRRPTLGIVRFIRWTRVMWHLVTALAIVAVIFPRTSTPARARLVRWWSAKLLGILHVVLDVHGARPQWLQANLVVAANHITWLDIFVINAVRPARFVAKSEIRDWPVIGWLCEKVGTIFVMRARPSATVKINEVIHDVLAAGDCVGLFPEGATSPGNMMRRFHSSLFEPAVANRATVAPAAIRYRHNDGESCLEAAYVDDLSFTESLGMIIRQPIIIAEITFAPRIDSAGRHRRELAVCSENAVAAILGVRISRERLALGGRALAAKTTGFGGSD